MDREGNRILFNPKEQQEFDVAESAPVESALETAHVFAETAKAISTRTEDLIGNTDPHSIMRRRQAVVRAARLQNFANQITGLCVGEEAESAIRKFPGLGGKPA